MVLRFLVFLLLSNFAVADELKVITAANFLEANPNMERKEIVSFITDQFNNKPKVSQADLDKVWNNLEARNILHMARFQIVNQKLYAASEGIYRPYFLNLLEYFKKFIQTYKIADVDFIIYARDEIPPHNLNEEIFAIPSFMMFRNLDSKTENNTLIIPDSSFLKKSWGELINKLNDARTLYAWDNKIEQFFWRGASTGGEAKYEYNLQNITKFPRLKFVMLSKLYPQIIDAQFFNPIFSKDKSGKDLQRILEILFGKQDQKISEIDHLKYKYLISIDGNTATGTRVPWIMFSGSPLIKQESNKIEWFYSALKPYIHYVPIKQDFTDIFQLYNWLKEHNEELKQISLNGQEFVQNNLLPEHIDSHMVIILNEYAKLQKDQKIIATLTPADDVVSVTSVALVIGKKIKRYFKDLLNF